MPDRWSQWCRRLVPSPLRARVFDPALADLEPGWASDGRPGPVVRGQHVFRLALGCRRLEADPGVPGPRRSVREQMTAWIHDARLAARRLRRQPLFAATAILTLALGIGVNVAVFAFVHAFLLSPVNASEPYRLVGSSAGHPRARSTRSSPGRPTRTAATGHQASTWPRTHRRRPMSVRRGRPRFAPSSS